MNFEYHRSVAPMVWVLFGLAFLELLVVHLLVSLIWPWLAWPLSFMSLLTLLWLISWIRSFKRLPHALVEQRLILRMGSLRTVEVALTDILTVHCTWPSGMHKDNRVLSLVPVAYPNRLVQLKQPLPGRRKQTHVSIKLDSPVEFDAALAGYGIVIRD